MKRCVSPTTQHGATLLVGLIMLLLITMLAVSAIRMSTLNHMVVANEQYQTEAEDAAIYEIDRLLGTADFIDADFSVTRVLPAFQLVAGGEQGAVVNEPGYVVTVRPPECKRYRFIKIGELLDADGYPRSADAAGCIGNTDGEITIVDGANASDNSLCATSLWEVSAAVAIPDAGANVTVFQGVEMRLDWSEAQSFCEE